MGKRTKKNPQEKPIENPAEIEVPITETKIDAPEIAVNPPAPEPNPSDDERPKNPRRSRHSRRKHGGRRRRGKKKVRTNPIVNWSKAAMIAGGVLVTGALGYGIYRKVTAKNRVPSCGDKYKHLAVTISGQTIEDPYGFVATFFDYEEWYDIANKLSVEAAHRFQELGQSIIKCVGTGATNCDYHEWDALVSLNNKMAAKFEDLMDPSFFSLDLPTSATYGPMIQQTHAVIFDALCLMERSDAGIVKYGGTVPVSPTVTNDSSGVPAWKWFALGGVVTAGLGGVGYALGRKPSSGGSSVPVRPSLPAARATRPE